MMKKLLFILCIIPSLCLAANDDIADRPELGTAVNTDSILAVNAGNAAGSRLSRILFQGTAGYVLTGNGTWYDLATALSGKAASLGADDNYVTDAEKTVIGNTSGTNTGDNAVNSNYSSLVTMTYPGAGIPLSTGSAWGTSYSLTSLAAALDGEAWTFTGAVDLSGASSVTMGPLSFEGATTDEFEATFSITDPTADRTITVLNINTTIPASTAVDASGLILSAGLADGDLATYAGITPAANVQSLLGAANYAAMRTLLDLESGIDFNVAASDTAAGISELAIASEINTGTDTGRVVTPDALAGSNLGTKEVGWLIKNATTVTSVADGLEAFVVPASMNGMNLVDVTCSVADLNSAASGDTTIVLRRVRGATAADMTSTGVTIAYTDYTASDETVDTANDDLATGDKIYVDVNAVTTAVHKGLGCTASFKLP